MRANGALNSGSSYPYAICNVRKLHVCIWATALTVFFTVINRRTFYIPEDLDVKSKNSTVPSRLPRPARTPAPSKGPTKAPTTTKPTRPKSKTPHLSPHQQRPNSAGASNWESLPPSPPVPPLNSILKTNHTTLTATEQTFIDQYCDFSPSAQWYPTGRLAWQQRAPYAIILGTKHSGTTSLYQALLDHEQISDTAASKDLGFFLPRTFRTYQFQGKTKVYAARHRMYAGILYKTKPLQQHSDWVALDGTSGYLFYSHQVPYSILCLTPWAKLIVVLRNPIDRVYAHWAHGREYQRLPSSFEDWIAPEFAMMKTVGLVPTPSSQKEEEEAWRRYHSEIMSLHGAIGRSLYILQLRQWFAAYKQAGMDPDKQFLIVTTEQLQQRPQMVYSRILQFLQLPQHTLTRPFPNLLSATSKQPPMKAETRKMLKGFFAPYNDRLVQLLQEYKFLNWNQITTDWK